MEHLAFMDKAERIAIDSTTVTYECGCEVRLTELIDPAETDVGMICLKHLAQIKEINRKIEFISKN